jgi:photosystem II stability/assembly factor-like uncharacterized protein
MKRFLVVGLILAAILLAVSALPAEEVMKGQWVNISDALIAKLAGEGAKPGYAGPTAGIAADHATGDVYLVVNDLGLYKSSDKGATFARVADGKTVGGRCETAFALDADPAGTRLMCFMIYGSSAYTDDGGRTWLKSAASHLDFGQVDWTDAKTMIALRHEAGGMICLTTDGAKTWKDLGKGFSRVGLFDSKTLLATKEKEPGILRSTDGGETWTKTSDLKPAGLAMRTYKGIGYWTSEAGLLASKDKGATWAVLGSPVNCLQGPFFGKNETHIVVVGKEGFHETTDAGKTWRLVAPLPAGYTADRMTLCAWDATANIFYISRMTKPAFKYAR